LAFKSQRIIELIVCNPFDFVTDLADVPVLLKNQAATGSSAAKAATGNIDKQRKRRRSSALE